MASPTAAYRDVYDLAFQISPVILSGGIVSSAQGGLLPIIGLVGQLAGFSAAVATSGQIGIDDFFARFIPTSGANVISNAIGTYPFANQQVAANAIIEQPLNISLQMISPVRVAGGYLTKLAIFTALRNSLQAHNDAGGVYHIATPAYIYTNCVMTAMTDITSGETKQQNVRWQLDFVKPLITQIDASAAYGALINKLTAGTQLTNPTWSGPQAGSGSPVQGSTSGITGMPAAISNFLSQPL